MKKKYEYLLSRDEESQQGEEQVTARGQGTQVQWSSQRAEQRDNNPPALQKEASKTKG